MRLRSLLAAVLLAALAAPAAAESWLCSFPNRSDSDWISPQTAISRQGGEVLVASNVTCGITGGPIRARIAAESDRSITISWRVDVTRTDLRTDIPALLYRIAIPKAGGRTTMLMQPLGSGQSFNGSGTCAPAR